MHRRSTDINSGVMVGACTAAVRARPRSASSRLPARRLPAGGDFSNVFEWVMRHGAVSDKQWPYKAHETSCSRKERRMMRRCAQARPCCWPLPCPGAQGRVAGHGGASAACCQDCLQLWRGRPPSPFMGAFHAPAHEVAAPQPRYQRLQRGACTHRPWLKLGPVPCQPAARWRSPLTALSTCPSTTRRR